MSVYSNSHCSIEVTPAYSGRRYIHCKNLHKDPLIKDFFARFTPGMWQYFTERFNNWTTMYELTYVLQQNEIDLFAALPGALAQADAFITENYLKLPKKRMATMLNRSDTFVRRRLNVLGLVVPKELSEQFSKDSRIQQGAVPPNKGKKQTDYMSAEAIEATKATRFKKGQICQTEKQDGQVTVRHDEMKDGSIRDYKWIRIGKSKWKMLHVYNWEKKHKRKVPKGHILVFANGDSMNCNPSNLELITRAENMRRNTIHRYPEELKSVIKLRSKLNKTIHNQTKKVKQ